MPVPRQALLDGLRAFSVAARQLSFKAAADALFVTPSAISHRIRDLEKGLGQRVFVRKTRAVELTDSGRALLDEIEPLLAGLDAAVERAAKRARRRVLRITAPPWLATELLIPSLRSFYGMQARTDLDIVTSSARPLEHGAQADVSIVIANEPPAGCVATRLFTPKYVAATARPVALVARELGSHVFEKHRRIVYRPRAELWTRWLAITAIPLARGTPVLHVDTLPAAITAAEHGLGIALVPTFVCDRRPRPARLVRIADSEVESGEAYFVVHRAEDRARPELRAFLSWALAELRR